MQQHPVPQNISSYQFHLIGDMTLKQFLELLGGGLIAFIFYSTNLPDIIKWFFVIISLLGGVGLAFLPLDGVPLDRWLLAFIKAAYRPNQFYWKKSPTTPDYLKSPSKPITPVLMVPIQPAVGPQASPNVISLPPLPTHNPLPISHDTFSPTPTPIDLSPIANELQVNTDIQAQSANFVGPKIIQHSSSAPQKPQIITESTTSSLVPPPSLGVPQTTWVKVGSTNQTQTPTIEPVGPINPQPVASKTIFTAEARLEKPDLVNPATVAPTQSTTSSLPFPSIPERPNVLVGMILDKDGGLVDNAVIEIADNNGNPVRATKTNRLGQFFSVTPLPDGDYVLLVEKPGIEFSPVSVSLIGKVQPPLEIRAN